MKKYFKQGFRYYNIAGNEYIGVTSVLKLLGKGDRILSWNIKQVIDLFAKKGVVNTEVLSMANKWHKKVLNEKADDGTKVHKIIEDYLTKGKYEKNAMLDKFIKWKKENNFQYTACEKVVCSNKYETAGTIDLIGTVRGVPFILDIKSSKGVWLSHKIQVCAYKLINGDPNYKVGILALGKPKPFFPIPDHLEKDYMKVFVCLNHIFKTLNELHELPS